MGQCELCVRVCERDWEREKERGKMWKQISHDGYFSSAKDYEGKIPSSTDIASS